MSEWRLWCQWDGEAFYPVGQAGAVKADKTLVIGERYMLTEYHDRSRASHGHYFAQIEEVFRNLPEEHAGRFRDAEHLRKAALVACGYYVQSEFVFSTKEDATRAAALITEDGAAVTVYRNVLIKRVPMSQSYKAMGRKQFQESKEAVLDWLAEQLCVSREQLAQAAE